MEAGYIYLAMRKYAEARAVFEGVCVLAPKSAVPLVAIGNVYFAQCQYGHAIRSYRKALAIEPESAFAKAYLGESLLFEGNKEMAIDCLHSAIDTDVLGSSAPFAKSLLDLIAQGFDPCVLAKQQSANLGSPSQSMGL